MSELIGLCFQDITLGAGAHIRCCGKGRKERCIPLRKDGIATPRAWSRERGGQASDPLFPGARGQRLSRDVAEYLLAKHMATARLACPSLKKKRVSPHVLRHSTAMDLLQHGVDRSVIVLWLGHESMPVSVLTVYTFFCPRSLETLRSNCLGAIRRQSISLISWFPSTISGPERPFPGPPCPVSPF